MFLAALIAETEAELAAGLCKRCLNAMGTSLSRPRDGL